MQWSKSVTPDASNAVVPETPATIADTDPAISIELISGAPDESRSIRIGEGAEVILRGFEPGSVVTVTVNSSPRAVASLTADSGGVARGVVYIPLDLPTGQHQLRGSGFDAAGRNVVLTQTLAVSQPLPWWWWPTIGLAILAALAAVIAAFIAIRASRATRLPADHFPPDNER